MNNSIQLPATNPEFSPVFRELLGCLFHDPFSLNNNFKDLSFEDIGLVLEESFAGPENLNENYEACKSTYCLMLIELDLSGYSALPKILCENSMNDIAHLAIWPSVGEMPMPTEEIIEEVIAEEVIISADILEITPLSNLTSEMPPAEEFSFINSEAIPVFAELNPVTALKIPIEPPKDSDDMTTLGQNYLKLAELFKLNVTTNSISIAPNTSQRATIQFLVMACELEIFKTLHKGLVTLWPEREIKIQELLKVGTFKFNDKISQVIQEHQNQFADWLYDAKFPELAALHCLRYLVLTPSIKELHPSVFELATFIYFWGALGDPNTESLCHQFDGPQPSQSQMIEIAFRLFRLDRIKAHANNFNSELSNRHFDQAQEDTTRILELLNGNSVAELERDVA